MKKPTTYFLSLSITAAAALSYAGPANADGYVTGGVKKGVEVTTGGVKKGVDVTVGGVKKGVDVTVGGTKKGLQSTKNFIRKVF